MSCTDKMYLTGNPICSNNPRDLSDNARVFDAYVNSAEFSVTDRFGVERVTLAWVKWRIDTAIDEATGEIKAEWQTGVANINSEETAALNNINTTTAASLTSIEEAVTDFVSDAVPVGIIQTYIGENAPNDKWLLCRGQAFSAESYPDLALLLPDLKIPDLRGVALRGLDANRGFDPNRELLSYQEDAMQLFELSWSQRNLMGASSKASPSIWPVSGIKTTLREQGEINTTPSAGYGGDTLVETELEKVARTSTETVMKNVAVNFIIKAR